VRASLRLRPIASVADNPSAANASTPRLPTPAWIRRRIISNASSVFGVGQLPAARLDRAPPGVKILRAETDARRCVDQAVGFLDGAL